MATLALATVLLLPAMAAGSAPAVLPDTIEQRLLACTACHAPKQVRDDLFPRIAGKPAGYLYKQLINFREGRRQSPLMTYMVDHLPDSYLHEIADHFASLHPPAAPVQASGASADMLARGRVLVKLGDPARNIPACIKCHGEKLGGVAPAIPGLLGLPRDYINAQLGAWRNRVRHADAPDCMAGIAAKLSAADVAAVSSWLVTQVAAPGARPALAIARPLPVACGSAPD